MFINGDRLIAKKEIVGFLEKGDIAKVTNVSENGLISFVYGKDFINKGMMSLSECEKYFEKIIEKNNIRNTVTPEEIEAIIENSQISVQTVFDKCTVVSCKLPNGLVIVEHSDCVNPENYNKEIGKEICLEKIADKIWELEWYRLKIEELYKNNNNNDYNCCDCEDWQQKEQENGDGDCEECLDYTCPYNENRNR